MDVQQRVVRLPDGVGTLRFPAVDQLVPVGVDFLPVVGQRPHVYVQRQGDVPLIGNPPLRRLGGAPAGEARGGLRPPPPLPGGGSCHPPAPRSTASTSSST